MFANDVRDFLAALVGHHRAGRRLQGRRDEQCPRAGLGERPVQRIRQQAVLVAGNAVELIAVQRGQRDHAGIAEAFGQHRVMRCSHHVERNGQRMLAAMGDEQVIDIGLDAELRRAIRP